MPLFGWSDLEPGRGAAAVDRSNSLAQGLVGFWPFNEGAGPPANLAAPPTPVTNSIAWVPGVGGQRGWVLRGIGGAATGVQVTTPPGSPLDVVGTGISFGVWSYPTTVPTSGQNLICKAGGPNSTNRQYSLQLGTLATVVQVTIGGNNVGSSLYTGNFTLSPGWVVNTWNALLVTYDGATLTLYLNGRPAASAAVTGAIATVGGSVLMGYDPYAATYGLYGSLDTPAVWSRALSAAEVASYTARRYQLLRPTVDIAWLLKPAAAPVVHSRRTLADRSGTRGVAF